MTSNKNFITSLMTLAFFALSMTQISAIDDSLFGGRSQFLCRRNSDIVKLNAGEPRGPIPAGANIAFRFSFDVQKSGHRAKCTTTGLGDVDLFLCTYPEADRCIAETSRKSVGNTSEEEVTSPFARDTYYLMVKANVGASSFTIQCDEEPIL